MKKETLMSFGIAKFAMVPSILLANPQAFGIERHDALVLMALLDKCWGTKTTCHPSVKRLALQLNYKLDRQGKCTTVRSILKKLADKQLITITPRGNRKTHMYDLTLFFQKCGMLEREIKVNVDKELKAYKAALLAGND